MESSKEKRMVISLILFRCAKHSILPRTTMEKIDLNEYLASNEYPGRGIAVAKAPDGRQMFIGYFIKIGRASCRERVSSPV